MEPTKTLRNKIAARMAALAAMTVKNGASETEAALAFDKLQAMQKEYNFYLDAETIRTEEIGIAFYDFHMDSIPALTAISMLTNVKMIPVMEAAKVLVSGTRHDAEYAMYLLSIVTNAMHTGYGKHILSKEFAEARKQKIEEHVIRSSYHAGIVDRLAIRILSLAEKNTNELTLTGKEVVVIKDNAAETMLNNLGIETQEVTMYREVEASAYNAGVDRAEHVSLYRGIGTNDDKKHLLH